jgi:hypothetical protein
MSRPHCFSIIRRKLLPVIVLADLPVPAPLFFDTTRSIAQTRILSLSSVDALSSKDLR